MNRFVIAAIGLASTGCVFVGPSVDALVARELTGIYAYKKFLDTEQAIEGAGYQRIWLIDANGQQTLARMEVAGKVMSAFLRTGEDAKQVIVDLILDQKRQILHFKLHDAPAKTTLSSYAEREAEILLEVLKGTQTTPASGPK